MNRILLIGNGFDLAHDLKTKYEHFIDDYWTQKAKSFQDAYNEKKLIGTSRTVYKYEDEDNTVNGISYYSNVKFSNHSNNIGYEYFLHTLFCVEVKNNNLSFKNKFLEQLNKKNISKNWVDIENEYYLALNQCLTDKCEDRIEQLNKDFLSIKKALYSYLRNQIKELPAKLPAIESIIYSNPFDVRFDNSNFIIYLNFNYTYLEKIYQNDMNKDKIIHIHGMLDEPRNPIIFGYGDELDDKFKHIKQNGNNSYLENVKSIKYAETRNYRDLLTYINNDAYEVFILGHSCGVSDRTLLNLLFEHENCKYIKVFYHKRKDSTDNYSDLIQNIYRNFSNKNKFREKVINKEESEPLLDPYV